MLPKGWKNAHLASLCEKISDGIHTTPNYDEHSDVFFVNGNNIQPNGLNFFENTKRVSQKDYEKYKKDIGSNTILMSINGTIGNTCLYNNERVVLGKSACYLNVKDNTDLIFILHSLRSSHLQNYFLSELTGTTIRNLSLKTIKTSNILLPPLPEQKKIAAILSTWDRAIEGTEKLLANSQQQKKALMQQLLTGKKRLPGFSGEWKTVTIGSLLKEVKRPVEWEDDNFYKLLSVKRRSEGVILREVLHGTKILTKKMNYARSGDFLISKMQVVHGASGLVPEHLDNHHISDSYIALRAKNPEKFDIEFFSWLSKERVMYYKTFLCSYGVTIEKMTFNFNMYLKENIKIPPTITEQRSISQLLNTTENEITALESDLSRLRQEKKALMQQLLTGKRRVTVD